MRLFLSSYRAGRHDKNLLNLLGMTKKVALISNAKDYKTLPERQKSMRENFTFWKSIGVQPSEIDLRPYFNKPGAEKLLAKYDFVWLAGGNTFLLRRALKYTGIDKYLIKRVGEDSIIYGGESAGAIMAGPTLRGSEDEASPDHEDDPRYAPKPYEKEILWDGLGFLNYAVVPHYKSGDYAAEIDDYVERLNVAGLPHKEMTDEQAIIIDGDKEEFLK